jgi:hypothetical protein
MKICPNCKNELDENNRFCTNCGTPLSDNTTTISLKEESSKDPSNGNVLGIIALILHFGSPVLTKLFDPLIKILDYTNSEKVMITVGSLMGLAYLSSWIFMIVGRVKYPNNKLCKITMWIFIIFTILEVIGFILLMVFCYITCNNIDWAGCY